MTLNLKKMEDNTFKENDSVQVPPPDIIAYNELRSCADLFRMYMEGNLEIQPEFQREIVWKDSVQTRFIDSLVKQLPIPSMCFSLDYKSQKWKVIDGLQRMASIIRFLEGGDWILSKLDDIDPALKGQSIKVFIDRKSELHTYFERVENLTLPITVLRCDYSKKSHLNYLFMIFHRLNTGGETLNNQEIRNCIYGGPLNELLKELDKNDAWMKINRMKKNAVYRFTKQELILRLFAFHDKYGEYGGRLARFLNDYMADNQYASQSFLEQKKNIFNRSIDIAYKYIFEGKTPPKELTISFLEAMLVGISLNLEFLEGTPSHAIRAMYKKLLKHSEFSKEKLSEGLSGKMRVIGRMAAAKTLFAGK